MYHGLALILCDILWHSNTGNRSWFERQGLPLAYYFFTVGTLLFSGSLYLLVITRIGWLGAITPVGGTCFLVGWILVCLSTPFGSPKAQNKLQ